MTTQHPSKTVKNCFVTSIGARLLWLPSKSSIFMLSLGLLKKVSGSWRSNFKVRVLRECKFCPSCTCLKVWMWAGFCKPCYCTDPTEDMEEESMDAGKWNASPCFSQQSWPKQHCLLLLGLLSALGFVASSVLKCPARSACSWQKSGRMRGLWSLQLLQYKVLWKKQQSSHNLLLFRQ